MREIGGFFELELPRKDEYHKNGIRLNTGRNSLEYIIKANKYKKIYIPYYICSSMLEPINKLGIEYKQYNIDSNFNPIIEFEDIKKDELFLYVNYFGVCSKNVEMILSNSCSRQFHICIDNTQSFYSLPKGEEHTIYSARKFFGVPDGAYLYTINKLNEDFDKEVGFNKVDALLKRIDLGCNEAYEDFKKSSIFHRNKPIKQMSNLSRKILNSIDYEEVKKVRIDNFKYIHLHLKKYNKIKLDIDNIEVPMVYPFLDLNAINLREYLIKNYIYVAQYWPGIIDSLKGEDIEKEFINNLISIPIDQRYSRYDMERIVSLIEKSYENILI